MKNTVVSTIVQKKVTSGFLLFFLSLFCTLVSAQSPDTIATDNLKKLSLEDLMNVEIEITSVSKRPERLNEAASAIQVITQEDIHNSGATNVPEALRLAPNLQVAQVNASEWAISARGFNNVLANKLLVMIDGRVVYTPMYAGVFWDIQNLMLADVDRIEVISGPGGTLWGANAVNGVINIITKKAKDTKGLLVEAIAGTELLSQGNLRYGGKITDKFSYRAYGSAFKRGSTVLTNGLDAHDSWTMGQGGVRLDWDPTEKDQVAIISNIYTAQPDNTGKKPLEANGQNLLGRWSHTLSEKASTQLQAYYDHAFRDFKNGLKENLRTYDLDWQHRFQIGKSHKLVWGAGIRFMNHNVDTVNALISFQPTKKTLHVFNIFVQDEIMLIQDRLRLTLGSKIEHNNYTEFQYQPSARLTWIPNSKRSQVIWGAISRAVRNPSRIDRELYATLLNGKPYLVGSSNFESETLLAYELGWRIQPVQKFSVSLSSFYNFYDDIRSAEPAPAPNAFPIVLGNGVKGETYGVELAASHEITKWWNLKGGYTFLKKNLWIKSTSADLNKATAESNDPENQFLIQSFIRLPKRVEFGSVFRYIDRLSMPKVPDYVGLDLRLGWKITKVIELNIVGQNLINNSHAEFIPDSPSPRRIERSVYGRITCRF